jgi:predicted CXXCH cytochrome family protein
MKATVKQIAKKVRLVYVTVCCLLSFVFCLLSVLPALSQESPCLICHGQFKRPAKAVHAALGMGCETCHQAVEGMKHPQQKGSIKLMQDMPGLCHGCHEESKFKGKVIHSPVAGGMCTGCHNPHQSEFNKILLSDQPDLCYNCHDKADFTKKNVHMAVLGGCGSCHSPHASQSHALLLQPSINGLCLQCHPNIPQRPHAVARWGGGHPLRGKNDPVRKGKEFSCISCHDPHSSDSVRLFRYKADSGIGICKYCHKF